MNITIQDIVTLNERGQRRSNEDYIFPEEYVISSSDTLFMVCDGVGGSRGGEYASKLVCKYFSEYLLEQGDVFQTQDVLRAALAHTERCLDDYTRSYPEYEGMATTLAYLKLTDYGAVIAWVGDSRIVQIREGKIIRQTKDHSLVNALLDYGEITKVEAAVHPKRNVLLRAVSGAGSPTLLDVLYIDDILPGDYFLLCTDGIIDGLGDQLEAVFAESISIKQLKQDIDLLCRRHTTDNYSMILLRIGQVTHSESDIEDINEEMEKAFPRSARVDGPENPPGRKLNPYLVLGLISVLVFLGWWVQRSLPVPLQVALIGENGVLIRDDAHTTLIDAFPLSDKVALHRSWMPVRQAMLEGRSPYNEADRFLMTQPPQIKSDSVAAFLRQYLEQNAQVTIHPRSMWSLLSVGQPLFQDVYWEERELEDKEDSFIRRLPPSGENEAGRPDFVAFLLRMNHQKNVLYAGDPRVNVEYIAHLDEEIDYVLINEWSLRHDRARQVLTSTFEDRQLLFLPSAKPMNNRQREEIRKAFPGARFLSEKTNRFRLR